MIGSGPNGLAAAIVLAQAGLRVDVYEAEAEPGGAARTLPLTLPGFLHDFGSAVHPFAVGSPFFNALPLAKYGLEWIHGDAPLAHPLDDGTAVVLERDLGETERALGVDGKSGGGWSSRRSRSLEGVCERCARAGAAHAASSVAHGAVRAERAAIGASIARNQFTSARTRAIFAGLAGHSFLSFDQPLSATVGLMFGVTVHAVGWPIPRGGAQAIPRALIGHLKAWAARCTLRGASMRRRFASSRRRARC